MLAAIILEIRGQNQWFWWMGDSSISWCKTLSFFYFYCPTLIWTHQADVFHDFSGVHAVATVAGQSGHFNLGSWLFSQALTVHAIPGSFFSHCLMYYMTLHGPDASRSFCKTKAGLQFCVNWKEATSRWNLNFESIGKYDVVLVHWWWSFHSCSEAVETVIWWQQPWRNEKWTTARSRLFRMCLGFSLFITGFAGFVYRGFAGDCSGCWKGPTGVCILGAPCFQPRAM